jgi:hypothetical protein
MHPKGETPKSVLHSFAKIPDQHALNGAGQNSTLLSVNKAFS